MYAVASVRVLSYAVDYICDALWPEMSLRYLAPRIYLSLGTLFALQLVMLGAYYLPHKCPRQSVLQCSGLGGVGFVMLEFSAH